ncbi:MAG: sulfite exporter TauE/SafE family protein [Nitrospiraceae bacterium]|nr:sulfite exporter TauE/SafE family protein [Nitrospiraceae bacterium]
MHDLSLTTIAFFVIALLYSTVGHAGASGYLATMALLSFAPSEMKPAALGLNIVVALVTSLRFYQAGHFSWRMFWPFALASVPLAYLGGGLSVHATIYKALVGVALVFAAVHIIVRSKAGVAGEEVKTPGIVRSMAVGGVIGFLSGLTGVGGGIFLSPVLIMLRWAGLRQAAALSAVFILVNSLSGLVGHLQKGGSFPEHMGIWTVAVLGGGLIGSTLGATKLNNPALRYALGGILVMAGMKMVIV